jgi:hypothetical protein
MQMNGPERKEVAFFDRSEASPFLGLHSVNFSCLCASLCSPDDFTEFARMLNAAQFRVLKYLQMRLDESAQPAALAIDTQLDSQADDDDITIAYSPSPKPGDKRAASPSFEQPPAKLARVAPVASVAPAPAPAAAASAGSFVY